MTTDVDVQYFSHLNGLVLGNNWGDLIRLLDTCLVNGLSLPSVTSALIDEQGDVHLTFYANHNAMLFQIVELSDFNSVVVDGVTHDLNKKYRIKGIPASNQLILKGSIERVESASNVVMSNLGSAKLASLGYEIIFRDVNDVKRVYRAKDPTSQHPFIRVDESLASDTGTYNSNYAKYAMVGLLEHMENIDDFENPNVLQLPFDSADPAKNWKITGTGTTVARGWHRWYWAKGWGNISDSSAPSAGSRHFTLCGDRDSFYLLRSLDQGYVNNKVLSGCGLYEDNSNDNVSPNWFMMAKALTNNALANYYINGTPDGSPLMRAADFAAFYTCAKSAIKLTNSLFAHVIAPDYHSGLSNKFSSSNLPFLNFPFYDSTNRLRGVLKHICYSGKNMGVFASTPMLGDSSMYIYDGTYTFTSADGVGGFAFYLGELR